MELQKGNILAAVLLLERSVQFEPRNSPVLRVACSAAGTADCDEPEAKICQSVLPNWGSDSLVVYVLTASPAVCLWVLFEHMRKCQLAYPFCVVIGKQDFIGSLYISFPIAAVRMHVTSPLLM